MMGFAVGTKITALLSVPLVVYLFIKSKDAKSFLGFEFVALGAFLISNPFSFIYLQDFAFRISQMVTREGGMVFDSADSNPFKYLLALGIMVSPLILAAGLYGVLKSFKHIAVTKFLNYFFLGNILAYIIFFSIGGRRVDRWLLPVLPLILVYASYGLVKFSELIKSKTLLYGLAALIAGAYMYYPSLLLFQFQRWTPKSEAYLWMQKNTDPLDLKLAVTEEGLDPLNKLEGAKVVQYEVYESKNAQYGFPPELSAYEYVVLSSRPMTNFKRKEVKEKYPEYARKWTEFENTVLDTSKFKLVKEFVLPKPNLIPLSDVYVYQGVKCGGDHTTGSRAVSCF